MLTTESHSDCKVIWLPKVGNALKQQDSNLDGWSDGNKEKP